MNEPTSPLQSALLSYIPAQTHNCFKSITDKHSSSPLLLPFCVAASFFCFFSLVLASRLFLSRNSAIDVINYFFTLVTHRYMPFTGYTIIVYILLIYFLSSLHAHIFPLTTCCYSIDILLTTIMNHSFFCVFHF